MDAIGKYTILEVIGRGGMGTVYRARDTVIGRYVAIKVIADHVASLPKVKERLYQEATSAGRLSHENIMTIFDVGEKDGAPFLVMELLEGDDLRRTLDSSSVLTFERKMEIALQICRGLAYAHARGVVHRDIKPENICVLPSGRLKILDFGIARVESETRTMTHSSIGTPRYMSPEQVRGKEVDQRTDIFSFGVLLYELLSGFNPFDGSHVTAVIYKILHEEPEPITLDDEHLSADVQHIVTRCLEKDADERYPDFPTVIRDLENILARRQSGLATLVDDRRSISVVDEERIVPEAGEDDSSSRSRLAALWKPSDTEQSPSDDGTPDVAPPRTRRAAWIIPAAAAVILAFVVGAYLLMEAGSGTEGGDAATTSTASVDVADAEMADLREAALELRDEVVAEKANAEPWRDAEALADLYRTAVDSERVALEALQTESASSYERAVGALQSARNTFQAISAAGSDDAAALREQAESARQAMDRAMRQVQAQESSPLVADAFARAEADVRTGDAQFESDEYTSARISFGQAETKFVEIRRTLQRAAAAEELRRRSDIARNAMNERRAGVSAWGDEPGNAASFGEAERLRAEGIRLADAGRHGDALTSFERADAAYADVKEPAATSTPSGASAADEARASMLRSKASVPGQLRNHEDFAAATQVEQRAQTAYSSDRFDESDRLFREAGQIYSRVAALPPPPTPEDVVRETLAPLLDSFAKGLQEKDADRLQQLHSFLGAYSAMFDVAEDIRADISYADLNVSNGRATVSVSLAMSYKNKTQRMRTENQNVNLRWTLEELSNGTWQLRDVAPL